MGGVYEGGEGGSGGVRNVGVDCYDDGIEAGYRGGGDGGRRFGDYFVGIFNSDEAVHESQTYISPGEMLSYLLGSEKFLVRGRSSVRAK